MPGRTLVGMGRFQVDITMTGGHGCDRDAQPGDELKRCESPTCPDCRFRDFVATFADCVRADQKGRALFTHWPDDAVPIVDDLVTGTRLCGAFKAPPAPVEVEIGDMVTYHFTNLGGTRVARPAKVTVVWSRSCVNLEIDYQAGDTELHYGEVAAGVVTRTSVLLVEGRTSESGDGARWSR